MSHIRFDRVAMISDVHIGAKSEFALDDFRLDDELARLLLESLSTRNGAHTTLVLGGDFIDFAQTLPEYGKHDLGDQYGVTEAQSLEKLEAVMETHPTVFDAMGTFLARGGQILVLPGNHDIDFHWRAVFSHLRKRVGGPNDASLRFLSDGVIAERDIYIEHGNQYAFDNRFDYWTSPIRTCSSGPARLERPWGTLFMDLVYSDLKKAHPYVNKAWPHAALAWILLRSYADDESVSLSTVGRLVGFFVTKGKRFVLGRLMGGSSTESATDPQNELLDGMLDSLNITGARRTALRDEAVRHLTTDETQSADMAGLMGKTDERGLEDRAIELLRTRGASIVAFGHTHEPIDGNIAPKWGDRDPRRFFNTGGWVPHIDVAGDAGLRVSDLHRFVSDATRLAISPRYLHIELDRTPRAELRPVPL